MIQRKFFVSIFLGIFLLVFSGYMNARISFFWKIQTEKGNSYLLGSVYFLNKEHYPMRKVIEDTFVQCDILAVGTNPAGENQDKINKLITEIGIYKGGKTLKDSISGKTYQLVAEKMRELRLNVELYKNFKPWLMTIIFLQKYLEKMGYDLAYSYEFYFIGKAKSTKKEIVELESTESQV